MANIKKLAKGTCIAAAAAAGAYLTSGAVIYEGALSRWGYVNFKPEEILNEDYNMQKYLNNEYFRKADDWYVSSDLAETKLLNAKGETLIAEVIRQPEESHLWAVVVHGYSSRPRCMAKQAIGFYEDLKELTKSHAEQPDIIVCCGCNIFDYNKPYSIRYRMHKIVENLNAALVFVNRTGGEGPFLFAGGSMAMNAAGSLLCQFPYFEEYSQSVDLQLLGSVEDEKPEAVELVYKALVMGLREYFAKNRQSRAVLGLSGGIDSALVCALAVAALGPENVHGILMPSQYSTDHSVRDAADLANNLGIKYDIVPIKDCFDALRKTMKPVFGERAEDVTEENMQARIRGSILMSYSNKFGALTLNTTNKSEAAMGYGTLYGDSCGSLSVIGDLYKTEVYQLSEWINREREIIPWNSIRKAPSAELRPGQKDSDSLPDYAVLDAILNLHIEEQLSAEEIVEEGYDAELVGEVLRKVRINEWKRLQFAPQLKVSPMTFGLDRRVPIS